MEGKGLLGEAEAMVAAAKPEKKLNGRVLLRLSEEYVRHGAERVGRRNRMQRGRDMFAGFALGE